MVNLDELKKEAKRVLEDGKVKYVIGYAKSTAGKMAAPVFVTDPEKIENLIWDPTCVQNLTKFIVDEKKRKAQQKKPDTRPVAVVSKGCDSRAINVLLQEKYIERDDVFILGVACEDLGVIDEKKLAKKIKGKRVEELTFDDKQNVVATTTDGTVKIPVKEVLAERCLECQANIPMIYDVFLGEEDRKKPESPFGSVEEIEALSQKERWAFWQEQLSKCIRCYACRSVCPMCYCDECVVDTINFAVTPDTTAQEKALRIKWIERASTKSENFGYHLVRAIHLVGRCIDCGECERVCPLDIPIRFLNKKLEKTAKELFDYTPGMDIEIPALVASFKDEDPEEFIR
ncbi:MAG: hydrogenase [Candidatus Aminicenantes bacterium]|nr:hydrogenase [Candidatus Aminicenantes bacterium]